MHTSKVVHRLMLLGTAILVVTSGVLAGTAWRLAQGPIDLIWLSDRLKAALIDETAQVHVAFDGVSLAWEGFQKGVDYPLDLRISNITVTDPAGRSIAAAPQAHLTFSLAGLLLGRVVPRTIELDHARVAVTRESGGAINLGWDLGGGGSADAGSIDLRQLREQLSRPASSDHGHTMGLFDQIQRVHLRDAELTLRNRETGLEIKTLGMDLDLTRARGGRVHGSLRAPVWIDGRQGDLTGQMDWAAQSNASVEMQLRVAAPAGGDAGAGPGGSAAGLLAAADLPFSLAATIGFDADFNPSQVRAEIQAGPGHIAVAEGSVPLRSGTVAVSGTPNALTVTRGHFDLGATPEGNPETIDVTGTIARAADRLTAALTIRLTQIDIGDLPAFWPAGVAGSPRSWVTEHVTAGRATLGTIAVVVEADGRLHDVVLTKASGDLDVTNGTFTWIDNMLPVEQADAHLHLVDPNTLDIHVSTGRQRIRNGGADLVVRDGQMRISGLSLRDQIAVIRARIDGPVLSAMTLLKEPRLHLLSTHPIGLKIGGGDASATLDFQFPLENKLSIDDVDIHVDAHLKRVRLPEIAGGHELEEGTCDLVVGKDGLTLKGQGLLASVPVAFDGTMDFKSGPADQIVQKIAVTGRPNATQLDAAGLPIASVVAGPIPMTAVVTGRRSGDSSVVITGDLSLATLSIAPLAWSKPALSVANVSATLLMVRDKVTKINPILIRGDGLFVSGSADFADGRLRAVLLDTLRLGRTQGHGTVRLKANDPITVVLQGDQIDLAPKLTEKTAGAGKSDANRATTPAWTLDAHFDRALLANGERADDLLVKASGAGDMIRFADAIGSTRGGLGFSIKIEPRADKRRLSIDSKDAGAFLRGMDITRAMQSGHLTLDGVFDRPLGLFPLAGTAVIENVDVRNSPVLGKLLQAITVYGLFDALRGPGMNFSRVVVPFLYTGDDLDIDQAHADNPSLGLTAKGRIGLLSEQTAITGTIVPAYFFNSMLGQLPVIGKLFSPEKGGGIFAVRFGLDGPIGDPSVSINPVSALTPGFFREIFSIFDGPKPGDDRSQSPGK